jgi:predicted nucleic acid-binding protein
VTYLDTSVALAHLLGETRAPAASLWDEPLVSSRLLAYELRTRLHARPRRAGAALAAADELLAHVTLVELAQDVLSRALEPFPVPVRTLDALHLATMVFLRERAGELDLATYDRRLGEAARALGFAQREP